MSLSESEFKELSAAWKDVLTEKRVDDTTQFFFRGVNYRLNFFEAVKALLITAKISLKITVVVSTGQVGVLDAIEVASETFELAIATVRAVREQVPHLVYAACVYLGQHPDGLSASDFETGLAAFLKDPQTVQLPWYLGLSQAKVDLAKEQLTQEGFQALLTLLHNEGWLQVTNGTVKLQPRHFEWGFSAV